MDNQGDKIKLFGSDDDEDYCDDFKIRPQFQGPHGQELLELSSRLPERFKLDERFAEVFESEYQQDAEVGTIDEGKEEKEKNIKILESVLGHEICPKTTERSKTMKRQIRFDPDDENALHLMKEPETSPEKQKKSKKKKKVIVEKVEQPIPVSKKMSIKVCHNLKELLNPKTPFTFNFSQSLNNAVEEVEDSHKTHEESYVPVEKTKIQQKYENENLSQLEKLSSKQIMPKSSFLFFVSEGDPRLKEGIDFFKRPKSLDEIRVEWQKRRPHVLQLFKRKRKSRRAYSTRVQSMQNKYAVRKQNFKK